MIRIILIPLSYAIGFIISKFTKEELQIRKNWLKDWYYFLLLIPITIMNPDLCIITISAINYLKASHDYIYKIRCKTLFIENLFFILAGFIVVSI